MRRRFYLFTAILTVFAVAGGLFFIAERRRMPDWLQELYVQAPGIRVVQMDRAQRPDAFVAEPQYRVASYNRFQYTYSDETGQPTTDRLSLPYPPRDVRCILAARDHREQLFFVNFYSDNLWNHSWIVYQGPTRPVNGEFDAQLTAQLERLGCHVAL